MLQVAQKSKANGHHSHAWFDIKGQVDNVIKYVKQTLEPYMKIWDEAVLAATLDFVHNELGINKVFYHSHESGAKLKNISGNTPRNLYSKLPKQFCFEKTMESPVFLQNDSRFKRMTRKMSMPYWYRLNL